MRLIYLMLVFKFLGTGLGVHDATMNLEHSEEHQLQKRKLLLWDKFSVPSISALYSYDQSVVTILLNFIQIPENFDVLSPKHLELIKKYIYEWKASIQEPLEKDDAFKWNENLGTFYNHIPKSLSFPDIILRIVIRVQVDLEILLNFSEDLLWKENVVEKAYEAEAVSGIDSLKVLEIESASNSLASLSMTYNLHPLELFPPDTTIEKDTNLLVSFASAAVFSLIRKYFTIALEWTNAAIHLLSGELKNVWGEIHTQNEILRKMFPSDEIYWGKVQLFREKYEKSKTSYTARELEKLKGILNIEKLLRKSTYNDHKLKYEKSDLQYFIIFNSIISILHDQHWNTSYFENYLTLFPKLLSQENFTIQANKEVKEKHLRNYKAKTLEHKTRLNQDNLCRGLNSKSSKELSKYFCRMDSRNSSYLILMPAKVEVLNKDPEILFFHHIFGEKKIRELHQLDLPIATLAKGSASGAGKSYITFLHEQTSERVKVLNQLIGDLTGYIATKEIGGVESFIMNSYDAGGFFLPHSDASGIFDEPFDSEDQERKDHLLKLYSYGDQIASFIIYMNDDVIGGRTVYPNINLSVKPQRGSAVFWTNLFLNGSVNYLTFHAGCPVLSGIKLVAVKWIRSSTQMFRKPCGLHKNM